MKNVFDFIFSSKYIYKFIFISEATTYEQRKRTGIAMQSTNSINDIGRILIIFTGSFVSLALLITIVREIYKYRRFSTPKIVPSAPDDISEDNFVF